MHTTKEVASELNVSRSLIFKGLQTGRIKGVKIGNVWRVSEEEVARLKREGF